jgi:hypothetical protein
MRNPAGQPVGIPYSNVGKAIDQGHLFSDKNALQQYARDHAADPLSEDRVDQFIDAHPYIGRPIAGLKGAGTGVLKTITAGDRTPTTRGETELQLAAATPTRNAGEAGGEAAEGVGEYFTGDEFLNLLGKGAETLGLTQKLKAMSGIASTLEKAPPMVQKLVKIGMSAVKQGTIAAGQAGAKTGGDPASMAESGLATAGLSALTEGAGAGIAAKIRNEAPTVEKVGGVDTQVPASVRNGKVTPQQTAGKQSIKNAAQSTLANHLGEVNESRAVPGGPAQLPAGTGPFEFNMKVPSREETTGDIATHAAEIPKTHSHAPASGATTQTAEIGSLAKTVPNRLLERDTPGYMHSSAPGENPSETDYVHSGNLVTQDSNIARSHIENLNSAIDSGEFASYSPAKRQELLDARSDAQKQMAQYHERVMSNLPGAAKPNLEQINIPQAVAKAGSFSDAAATLEKTGSDGYNLLNDVTGGKFNALRNENKAAWDAYMGASGEEAQGAAERALDQSNARIAQMFSGLRGIVDPKNLDGFDDAYRNAQGLRSVASAVDGSFTGNSSNSARSWEQRGFDGNRLMSNLSRLQTKIGRGSLERLVGRDNLDTLFQVAELNRTNAQRARFGAAIKPVQEGLIRMHVGPIAAGGYLGHLAGLPWEAGAAAGWATAEGTKRLMNVVLTNPQIAKNLTFAIESGAKGENYGPFIASLVSKAVTEANKGEGNNDGN